MKMFLYKNFLVFFIFLLLPFLSTPTFAHRSGCHRWHSCPSDSGSYTCGDLGYPCRYSTYSENSYTYSVPTYALPAPTSPGNGNWKYEVSNKNWCAYDLTMNWDKPTQGDRYSIAISKTAGADPGPLVDTTTRSFTFTNVAPGKWYVNIKTGNEERWGNIQYWEVELPKITPSLSAYIYEKNNSKFVHYSISCLDKVQGPQEWIDSLEESNNDPEGEFTIYYPDAQKITLTGQDSQGKDYQQDIDYVPIKKELVEKKTNIQEDNGDLNWLWVAGLLGISSTSLVAFLDRRKNTS